MNFQSPNTIATCIRCKTSLQVPCIPCRKVERWLANHLCTHQGASPFHRTNQNLQPAPSCSEEEDTIARDGLDRVVGNHRARRREHNRHTLLRDPRVPRPTCLGKPAQLRMTQAWRPTSDRILGIRSGLCGVWRWQPRAPPSNQPPMFAVGNWCTPGRALPQAPCSLCLAKGRHKAHGIQEPLSSANDHLPSA